ncbi:MAG: hypothetical protein PWQ54_934, partial [Bacteroidales bacterium]|nr:hypothetical protein [Bacteroidales bacterium]
MLFYRQFWKKLALTAKKLVLKLVEIVYNTAIQVFTPPPPITPQKKQETKRRISYCLLFYIQKLPAWLGFPKKLCHATKD